MRSALKKTLTYERGFIMGKKKTDEVTEAMLEELSDNNGDDEDE